MANDHHRRRPQSRLRPVRWRPTPVTLRTRRRVGAGVRLVVALMLAGGTYAAFAPSVRADETPRFSGAAAEGEALFDLGCVTCHGNNAQGVQGRGPSLVGVGAASVEFQVGTGRMPLARQEAQAMRKPQLYTDEQVRQLAAYIQELGGGPVVPDSVGGAIPDADLVRGGELFRINCSQCHAFGGGGGALSSGKYAPSLYPATDRIIYAAMLSGPQNMPVFGDSALTPEQKADVIAYIQQVVQDDRDPGGFNLGRYGPSTEGLTVFLVGIVALVIASLWIAGKS
ncbi:menaquinol-cytochrome c reductase cytochrome c1 subunit precursor [Micromonospora citrea]|uniref:Cytochrome bc1 complex cytochrome c subunit n=1 Tax=Micromonospora citrea TaxID=47855 RepID=A0A1C6TU24_9ACTN|nr:c-type cytochrome [Micromonospora citrea]SCL45247.1 menaquinol-cytochrome c reductase cytochrome c1 subunit precursor [Micromonospora citrea]